MKKSCVLLCVASLGLVCLCSGDNASLDELFGFKVQDIYEIEKEIRTMDTQLLVSKVQVIANKQDISRMELKTLFYAFALRPDIYKYCYDSVLSEDNPLKKQMVLAALNSECLSASNMAKVRQAMHDENVAVRVYAVILLSDNTPQPEVFSVLVDALAFDDFEFLGDPPKVVHEIASQYLTGWHDKKSLLKYLDSYETTNTNVLKRIDKIRASISK